MRTGRRICSGFFSKSVSSLLAFRARAFLRFDGLAVSFSSKRLRIES